MDFFEFLTKKTMSSIGENKVAIGEADEIDFGIPSGTSEDVEDYDVGAPDMDLGDSFGDMESSGDDGASIINNPFEDIDESDVSLTTELRNNFAILYNDNKANYEKLISKNLDSSEFGSEFKEIQEQYKEILVNIRLYLKNKYNEEPLVTKILQLNNFKGQINKLHEVMNSLLKKIGVKDTNSDLW